VCDRQGLIGRELFAIDGVKLPSNASKARSGTRKEFQREARKMARLKQEAEHIRTWLQAHPHDRTGVRGSLRKSNRTDNESAKMATGKGVIQGYTGVAVVDDRQQIIVAAQAHGVGQEQELLGSAVEAIQALRTEATVLTADAGYHSEANLQQLAEAGIDAYLPDNGYRRRDPRYTGQERHRRQPAPLWNKTPQPAKRPVFAVQDFQVADDHSHCVCPAGARLYRNGHHRDRRGKVALKFTGRQTDCGRCMLRGRCLRSPQTTPVRQVSLVLGPTVGKPESPTARMRRKIDSPLGREILTRRFATVEPVFGNLRYNKRLDRFTLRGRTKVDGQWKWYCLVHNIEKLTHWGYAS